MKDKTIPFCHCYYKLGQDVFTTIRGKTWAKKFKGGEITDCDTPDGRFKVSVVSVELARVADMTLNFLKADAEYPKFIIKDKLDFVKLLNGFRAPTWQQVKLDSEM